MNCLLTGWKIEENVNEVCLKADELKLINNYRQSTKKSKDIILTLSEMVDKKTVKPSPMQEKDIVLFEVDMEK